MKKYISFAVFLCLCLAMLTGCGCKHSWTEADCITAKTCSTCGATEGEPLGHTPGQWNEICDLNACTITQEQSCTTCNKILSSKLTPITTMVQNGLFRFTPNEFLDRLAHIAKQHDVRCIYQAIDSPVGLQTLAIHDGHQSLIQFFHRDGSTLSKDERHSRLVWCVNITDIDVPDPVFRRLFLMACDPKLDDSAAGYLEWNLYTNYTSPDALFRYHQENGLLYEVACFPKETTGAAYTTEIINVYASSTV